MSLLAWCHTVLTHYYCYRAHYLNNHIRIVIHYSQKESFEGFRVVGFEVAPFSIKHAYTLPAGKVMHTLYDHLKLQTL
jgi:Endomembrane protein 70